MAKAFEHAGFRCFVDYNPGLSPGYVGYLSLEEGHRWFRKHYRDIELKLHLPDGLSQSAFLEDPIEECGFKPNTWEIGFWTGATPFSPFTPEIYDEAQTIEALKKLAEEASEDN